MKPIMMMIFDWDRHYLYSVFNHYLQEAAADSIGFAVVVQSDREEVFLCLRNSLININQYYELINIVNQIKQRLF